MIPSIPRASLLGSGEVHHFPFSYCYCTSWVSPSSSSEGKIEGLGCGKISVVKIPQLSGQDSAWEASAGAGHPQHSKSGCVFLCESRSWDLKDLCKFVAGFKAQTSKAVWEHLWWKPPLEFSPALENTTEPFRIPFPMTAGRQKCSQIQHLRGSEAPRLIISSSEIHQITASRNGLDWRGL